MSSEDPGEGGQHGRHLRRHASTPWHRPESRSLLIWILAASALWGGVHAVELFSGAGFAPDERLILYLRNEADPSDPLGPPWLEEGVRDLTSLGSRVLLILLTLLVCGFLVLARRRRMALALLAVIVAGMLLSDGLKQAFDRPRPELVSHAVHVQSASYPSGHALLAAVVYLTLGALLARLRTGRAWKLYCMSAALLLAALAGISRVYLGVHWPSDVFAGWVIGGAWALCAWFLIRELQSRGVLEAAQEQGSRVEVPKNGSGFPLS